MKIDILTLFPEMFAGPFDHSIIKRSKEGGLVVIRLVQIRDFVFDKHRQVDDYPFGGGPGMVMKPEPLFRAIESIPDSHSRSVILLTPQGKQFTQAIAEQLAQLEHLVLVCGHYEGIDERVRIAAINEELSIGDYVLSGGEIAAMAVVDAVIRLLPGALGASQGAIDESFHDGLLEYPQFTRPREFRGMKTPDILLSGNHAAIARWRREQALLRTRERRPDLLRDGHQDDANAG